MSRRPAHVVFDLPLSLVPPEIRSEIAYAVEELERIAEKKSRRHYYNISLRSRSVNRELRAEAVRAGERR
jgi:hypothetical protein|nr:hypothetical protein [uncultured Methanoregula sp.]